MRLGLICSTYVPTTFSQSQGRAADRFLDIPRFVTQKARMIAPRSIIAALSLLLFPIAGLAQTAAPAPAPSAAPAAATGDGGWLYRGSDVAPDPAWRFGTLENGLRYAVRRNPLPAGQVSIRVRIDVGALHEGDSERGWAHFVEHMLFKGTETYPDRQARQIWQQLGASFGSDTNAQTGATDTVYILNLPHAARAPLDTSLTVLAEMMARARFEPAAVTAERPVILAEKGRRPELTQRIVDLSRTLLYSGLRFADRDPIGTEATLNGATAEGLRDFYRRWYRPDRATIVMVGDADPAMMEELIRARFGGWRALGPAPSEPDYGAIAEVPQPVANLAYPGAPVSASLVWLRPYRAVPHTIARERALLEELLAAQIINRRLEAHARGQSAFIGAQVGSSRSRNIVETTQLQLSARDGRWREALSESFAIIGDALRAPPSAAEIARELENLSTGVTAAVQGDPTALSQNRADQLVGAIDSNSVVASARTVLDNFEANRRLMTPERVGAAMQALFTGSGPRLMLLSPTAVAGGEAALTEALAAARAAAPATRTAERSVSFADLPPLGRPGREVSRERIADMDVTIVRFANGSTLTFKHTDFERGSVQVRLRFGAGLSGLAPDRPSLGWLGGLVGPSGLAGLDLDGMERLLTGRRIGLNFGIAEDAFVLSAQTNAADLPDQLRLLATKLTHPRWDPALFARFQSAAVESFALHGSSAAARASREIGGVLRPGDQRWRPIERSEMENVTVDQFRAFFTPLLAAGPVHAIVVGDISLDQAVAAMRTTIAALPARPEPAPPAAAAHLAPPAPSPEPRIFTHDGDPNQAFALIGWSTFGGIERTRDRRALALAANMFESRLFDRLREEEGATYSPDATALSANAFPEWGIFYASAEIRPASAPTLFRIAREIVADLAAHPALPDEFERAQNPVLSGIERVVATNGYWSGALENWHRSPQAIENVRTYIADYRAITAEDVRRAVATYVTDQGDWSMLVVPARPAPARDMNGNQ
jgi:zinc protease